MTFDSAQPSNSPRCTDSILPATENLSLQEQLRLLTSIWVSLDRKQQQRFLQEPGNELASSIVDALYWMQHATKTKDEQDQANPYKPFPDYHYFKTLHYLWQTEPVLFVEKSRTMMVSWFAAAETLHAVMKGQPAKGIFWAQDEDRAIALLDYAWVLYERQIEQMKALYPLDRPRNRQNYRSMELADGGILLALPGKDPNKIRSEHPTILVMDECCFIENGGEAFDIAISSRVPKVVCVSSAAPSWFRRLTKSAVHEELPEV